MNLRSFLSEAAQSLEILIIGMSGDGKQAELQKRFKNSTFASWSDFSIETGELMVNGKSVSKFKFVLIGAIGKNTEVHTCLQEAIKANKIRSFSYGTPSELNNKLLQTIKMKQGNVNQVKTIISVAKEISASSLIRELKLPVVSKIIDGSQGKGVEKHDTKASLEKMLKKDPDKVFIFQEFIPNDGDVRVFYVRDRKIYQISRRSAKATEFRNNVSLGGKFEYLDDLPPEADKLAQAARKCMGFDVTGVDLIQHNKTKEWYVMEINAAPQFDGAELVPVIDAICMYIK